MTDQLVTQEQDALPNIVFTPAEAAAYLRISGRTLQSLRGTSHGPEFFKVGGSFRYTRAALDEYIKNRTADASCLSRGVQDEYTAIQ